MAKFIVRTEKLTTETYLVEADNEKDAINVAAYGESPDVLEFTTKTQGGRKVEPYTTLVKATGIVEAPVAQ